MNQERKERLNKFAHLMAAMLILLHGFEKLEHHTISGVLFFIAGTVLLLVGIFHHRLVRYIRSADVIFSVVEGLLSIIVAVDYIKDGKDYIQYMYVIAALAYFIRAIIFFRKTPPHSTPH